MNDLFYADLNELYNFTRMCFERYELYKIYDPMTECSNVFDKWNIVYN